MRTKDAMDMQWKLTGFFDIDNLKLINEDELVANVIASCCLIFFADDESTESAWVQVSFSGHRQLLRST